MSRWLRRIALALAVLLLGLSAAAGAYLWRATPRHDGVLSVKGLQAEVTVERDVHGIATIRAASIEDASWALGFVHAQDRLWQLETHRRIGSGRLAEAFGRSALDGDKFLRALGARRAAQAQWARIGEESRRVLEAYAQGINTWQREHLQARPPEMLALGLPLDDWTPVDSLAWAILMSWDLGANWSTELLRTRLALTLPKERIDELLPPYPGEAPLVGSDYTALMRSLKLGGALADAQLAQRIDTLLAAAPPSGVEGTGSNSWVLAGAHTASGAPLLANDPHLKLTVPSIWYFARVEVAGPSGFKSAGATMPGLPVVVLGQNEHVAWGFTNTNPDVQDLYFERFKPDDPMQALTPSGWARLGSVSEDIRVRGAPSENLVVRVSRHGPIMSDAGGAPAEIAGETSKAEVGLALRWTALDADQDPIAASIALNRARSTAEFVAAATRLWTTPMQNMLVADRQGQVAFVAAGRVPQRRADNELKGLVPSPGWDARYDWIGVVPAHETPRQVQPARGWIASANQRVQARDAAHFLTSEWAAPYRHERIEQMLRARAKHSIDDLAAMQADVFSPATQRLLPWLQRAQSPHALAQSAKAALAAFSGQMRADDAAPLIATAWARQLTRAVFVDELGGPEVYERVLGTRSFRDALEGVLERNDAWWCDDKRSAGVAETCAQQADAAFTRALDELQRRFGSDVSAWRWGDAHVARSEHRPFSRVKALAPLFELRARTAGGDTWAVNAGRVGMKPDGVTGELYLNEHAASMRAIYDLGEPARSRFMHSSGQSGLPWLRHYRSFAGPWARGEYVPLWAGAGTAVEASMRLRP